jgi:hypothetical protein
LIVAEHQTVDGLNRWLVFESRHQRSLKRLLSASPFTLAALKQARLAVLASQATRKDLAAQLKQEHREALEHGGQAVFQRITVTYQGAQETYYLALFISAGLAPGQSLQDRPARIHLRPRNRERRGAGGRQS